VTARAAPARWWRRAGEVVVCDLCPNGCRIGTDGHGGICGLRYREGGALWTRGWNGAAAIQIDPVEKKPLHHFLPGSRTLSLGMTGCNLSCLHCQNWQLSDDRSGGTLPMPLEPEDVATRALRAGVSSVSFTYNEPLISAEFWIEVAAACRRHGLRTVAVSNGFAQPACAREFFGAMDAANIDLKAFSDGFYRSVCKGRLEPVLRVLEQVRALGTCHLELATLLIPTRNDGVDELRALGGWVVDHLGAGTPLHVTAFHPDHRLRDLPPTAVEQVLAARTLLRETGLEHVYAGNVRDAEAGNTFCPGCGGCLVRRDGWRILEARIEDGKCPSCLRAVPGVWS